MVNRSWMTRRCAAANSCGVWNEGEDKREEERLPGEAASSWQPRLGARAAAAFQSQMSLINSSASQFIPILGDQTRKGELQKFEEAWGAFTLDTYPIWSSTHAGIFFLLYFLFLFLFFFPFSFLHPTCRLTVCYNWRVHSSASPEGQNTYEIHTHVFLNNHNQWIFYCGIICVIKILHWAAKAFFSKRITFAFYDFKVIYYLNTSSFHTRSRFVSLIEMPQQWCVGSFFLLLLLLLNQNERCGNKRTGLMVLGQTTGASHSESALIKLPHAEESGRWHLCRREKKRLDHGGRRFPTCGGVRWSRRTRKSADGGYITTLN